MVKKEININDLYIEKEEILKQLKGNYDNKLLTNDLSRIQMKIKYYTDKEWREQKLKVDLERKRLLFKTEAYNEYHKIYNQIHKSV